MAFRRRDYPELLEGILTSLAGGIAAEAHAWPPEGDAARARFDLAAPPASRVVAVYGARNGLSFRFAAGTDWELSPDGTALVWQPKGQRPDEGSVVEVSYLRRDDRSAITDLEIGGVARTIVEAVARETAQLHAELQGVYESAFVDTASGSALDNVVALVGIDRVPAGRARATIRFRRDPNMPGAITIPAGTRIVDAKIETEYETVETVTLSPAQGQINVEARDVEAGNAPVGAGVLTILPMPIAGITEVTNPAPAAPGGGGETDDQLRARARAFLQGSERATVGALHAALARQGLQGEIEEPADRPGIVRITPTAGELTPERREQLLAAIEDARPAGVQVEVLGAQPPATVDLAIALATTAALGEPARRAAHEAVRAAVTAYFANLETKADASLNQLAGAILAVKGVDDVSFASARVRLPAGAVDDSRLDRDAGKIRLAGLAATLGALSIADPALPTRADLRIAFPLAQPAPDAVAVSAALTAAFNWLTDKAAGDGPEEARTLSLGKLLLALPPPAGQGSTLAAFDAANPRPSLPVPSGTYHVSLFVAQGNGLTTMLANDGDSYTLGPKERLALGAVNIEAES